MRWQRRRDSTDMSWTRRESMENEETSRATTQTCVYYWIFSARLSIIIMWWFVRAEWKKCHCCHRHDRHTCSLSKEWKISSEVFCVCEDYQRKSNFKSNFPRPGVCTTGHASIPQQFSLSIVGLLGELFVLLINLLQSSAHSGTNEFFYSSITEVSLACQNSYHGRGEHLFVSLCPKKKWIYP